MNRLFALFLLAMASVHLSAQVQPQVTLTIDTVRTTAGSSICLPIRVSEFRDIQGMQWGLRWNSEVLQFTEIRNFQLRDLDGADFNIGNAAQGEIRMSWIPLREPFTLSLEDGTAIMEICFEVVENAPAGYQAVGFSNEVLTTEIYVDPALYDSPVVVLPRMRNGGVYVDEPGELALEVTIDTDPDCGNTAGTILISPTNGQQPYTYIWQGPNGRFAADDQASGLEPGIYHTSIADDNGLMAEVFSIVSIHGNPEPLEDFVRTVNIQEASCGVSDGAITLNADPIRTFTYLWNTGDTTATLANVPAGTYSVEVTNILGCVQSYSYQIPTVEGIEDLLRVEDTLTCDQSTALIGVLPEGETAYRFLWNTGDTTNLITVTHPDMYELTVSVGDDCQETFVFVVEEPEIDLSFSRVDGTFGCSDTSVVIGLSIDQVPNGLTASWGDGPTTFLREATQPGLYQLTLSQGSCSRNFSFLVEAQDGGDLFYQRVETPFTCQGEPARIGVANTDELDYSFAWSVPGNNDPELLINTPGTYTLTITSGRCSAMETFEVAPFQQPEFSFAERLDNVLTCDPNQTATIGFVERPQSDYQFRWNTGDSTSSITTADTGNYTLTVIEGICQETFNFRVNLSEEKNYRRVEGDLSCSNPSATIGIVPDQPGLLTVSGPDGKVSDGLFEVTAPGNYLLAISSGERCSFTENFVVNVVNSEDAFTLLTSDLDCTGQDTASIGLLPLPPLTDSLEYTWNTGDTTALIEVTLTGSYQVTVTSGINCFETYAIPVASQASSISYERMDNQLNCAEPTVPIGVIEPAAEYLYQWSNGATSPLLDLATPGTYQLTITDPASSCSRIETFQQAVPSIQQASIEATCLQEDFCGGVTEYSVQVSDGTAPFIYHWNTGQRDTLNEASTYRTALVQPLSVTVTDDNGCTVTLDAPTANCIPLNEFRGSIYFDCPSEPGENANLVAEVVTGGIPPFQFNWNNGQTDTSYFLSRTPYDPQQGLVEVVITDAVGQTGAWQFNGSDAYGCGSVQDNNLEYMAPNITVKPGQQFTYPIAVTNYTGVERSIYTITWDPCLLRADTIKLYGFGDTLIQTNFFGLEGTFETGAGGLDPNTLPDTVIVTEIVFTALNKSGVSPFLFGINEPATDANGNGLPIRPQHGSIEVATLNELVAAGDANRDGHVNHYDVLPIGLAYASAGPDRRRGRKNGTEFSYLWPVITPNLAINYRHMDADGNGKISDSDLEVIQQVWTESAPLPSFPFTRDLLAMESDSLIPGSTAQIDLYAGTESQPLVDAYGLTFTLTYSGLDLDPSAVSFKLDTNWMDARLTLVRHEPENKAFYIGMSRTDGTPVTGYGYLGSLTFRVPDSAMDPLSLSIDEVVLMDHRENFSYGSSLDATFAIDRTTSTVRKDLNKRITLFPNPAFDRVQVYAPGLSIERLDVLSLQGQILATVSGREDVRIAQLPPGLYLLRVVSKEGVATLPFEHIAL